MLSRRSGRQLPAIAPASGQNDHFPTTAAPGPDHPPGGTEVTPGAAVSLTFLARMPGGVG